jgi:hypothetical protein
MRTATVSLFVGLAKRGLVWAAMAASVLRFWVGIAGSSELLFNELLIGQFRSTGQTRWPEIVTLSEALAGTLK